MNLRTAFIRIAHENPETRTTLLPLVKQADKWETLPKGWTDESRKQFWDKITGDVKHKVTKCIKEMEGKFNDPGAFCASLSDRVDPGWRSRTAMEHTSPEALKEYLKEHPNADPKNHTVKKAPEKAETSGGEGWKSDPKVQKASKEREKAEKELKEFDEIFPKQKAELDKLTPKFEELREKAYNKGYIGSGSGELSKDDIKRLKEFSVDSEDLVSDYLYLKKEVAKGPPPKGARDLIVERIQEATKKEEEAIDAYEEEAANASYEKAMAEAKSKAKPAPKKEAPKKEAPKKEEPENKQASLRARVIRLAHTRPELRAALLPLLRTAMEHSSPEALEKYLKDHPNADPKNHTVKTEGRDKGNDDRNKTVESSNKLDHEEALLDYDESKYYDISDSLGHGDLTNILNLLRKHESYVPKSLRRVFDDIGPGDTIKRISSRDRENLKEDLENALSELRGNLKERYDLDED